MLFHFIFDFLSESCCWDDGSKRIPRFRSITIESCSCLTEVWSILISVFCILFTPLLRSERSDVNNTD